MLFKHALQAGTVDDLNAAAPLCELHTYATDPGGGDENSFNGVLLSSGVVGDDRTMAVVILVTRLAALAEAVAELRLAQQHAAQATGARRAAEHLHAASRHFAATRPPQPQTPAQVAQMDTPAPLRLTLGPPSGDRNGRASGRGVRFPHRPRGPAP
jgi:hypothetical protein